MRCVSARAGAVTPPLVCTPAGTFEGHVVLGPEAGSYPLTIRGTSGPVSHTATVTLVVNSDFTIAVVPTSLTVTRGGVATYTITVNGNVGTVQLSVTGEPGRSTATFNPTSIVNSGSSTLTVDTQSNVQRRTFTMTIRGTASTGSHTATATLVVQ